MAVEGPWHIDITPWAGWRSTGTAPIPTFRGDAFSFGCLQATAATIGSTVSWDVPLTAGTWALTYRYYRDTFNGAATVTLGGTTVDTVDMSGPAFPNPIRELTGIVVAASAVVPLTFAMNAKNPSATAYGYSLNAIALMRTA